MRGTKVTLSDNEVGESKVTDSITKIPLLPGFLPVIHSGIFWGVAGGLRAQSAYIFAA